MVVNFLRKLTSPAWLGMWFVILVGFFTYFWGFWEPQTLFWDENYHIASAHKYLHGVWFMEQHPPLGMMLIALGEWLFNLNANTTAGTTVSYLTGEMMPANHSFFGVRFFPTLLAWLTAPVLYWVFNIITKKPVWAVLLSGFYLLDTALIVHLRSAMLESFLLFFSVTSILLFLLLWKPKPKYEAWLWLLLGVSVGLASTSKLLGLLFTMCFGLLLLTRMTWRYKTASGFIKDIGTGLSRIWRGWLVGVLAFFVTVSSVWMIHFNLLNTTEPQLEKNGYYTLTPETQRVFDAGGHQSLLSLPRMFKEYFAYTQQFSRGVPRLDLCKPGENGSPWWSWPIGARSISYQWNRADGFTSSLYLQANPAAWWIGTLAVLLGVILLLFSWLRRSFTFNNRVLLFSILSLYGSYMIVMSQIGRVMYLYHYFIPLLLSFITVGVLFASLDSLCRKKLSTSIQQTMLDACLIAVISGYIIYSPFAYHQPLTDAQIQRRAIVPLWDLHCVDCPRNEWWMRECD
jgi:dolichyl-phosphate-mannose--protein O-mannosyl transferase